MSTFSDGDRDNLLQTQNRDGANLQARQALHDGFSRNRYGWHRWVFDQIPFMPGARILELGCGVGALWKENLDRLPDAAITLTDRSPGMLDSAKEALGPAHRRFRWDVVDAVSIPFPNKSFDIVIANHLLYHVPDRPTALRECHRVLAPAGTFIAATNGFGHLQEIDALLAALVPEQSPDDSAETFGLETGESQLTSVFRSVTRRLYDDALDVPAPDPILRYLASMTIGNEVSSERWAVVGDTIERAIANTGSFVINKSTGVFVCEM